MSPEFPCDKAVITDDDVAAVSRVLRSGTLSRGPVVAEFETAFADLVGARHAVAVSSGTAGLHLATFALNAAPDTRWISTPNTFVRTVNAVVHGGGVPVLVDINPETWLVEIAQLSQALERHRDKKAVAGVIPVHFAGLPVNMEALARLTKPHGVRVIEDASYALGAIWEDTRGTSHTVGDCAYSDLTVFSFDPNKPITTGEGGMITTNDDELAGRLRILRDHGVVRDPIRLPDAPGPWYYEMRELGFNFRLSELQAALGLSQLSRLAANVQARRDLALVYDRCFAEVEAVTPQRQPKYAMSPYTFYIVRVDFTHYGRTRAGVVARLAERGIQTGVHYVPLHLHPYYQQRFGFTEGQFPMAEQYYEEALTLPMYPGLAPDEAERIAAELVLALTT
jgi:dTDP-4-amino-4,6-dideoxygalactose transaminase